jgi:hypothetical protein
MIHVKRTPSGGLGFPNLACRNAQKLQKCLYELEEGKSAPSARGLASSRSAGLNRLRQPEKKFRHEFAEHTDQG